MIVAQFANYQRTISTDTLSANQEFTNSSRLISHDNRIGNFLDLFAEALCRGFLICRLVMLSWHSSTLRYDDALCASLFLSLCLSLLHSASCFLSLFSRIYLRRFEDTLTSVVRFATIITRGKLPSKGNARADIAAGSSPG